MGNEMSHISCHGHRARTTKGGGYIHAGQGSNGQQLTVVWHLRGLIGAPLLNVV